jgi:hypothetical protein
MTSQTSGPEPGYRGSLPTREDRLARAWILAVIAIFVLVILLSALSIPSRFVPEPTEIPLPSLPTVSESPSASPTESPSESPAASPSESASPSPTP